MLTFLLAWGVVSKKSYARKTNKKIGYDRNNIKTTPYFFSTEMKNEFFLMKNGKKIFFQKINKIQLHVAFNTPNLILFFL